MFENSDVVKLNDGDFNGTSVTHPKFKGHDGYIMFYWTMCPHCIDKQETWSDLARRFHDPKVSDVKFRIGAVEVQDPQAQGIVQRLGVQGVPVFFRVDDSGKLTRYEGDFDVEQMLSQIPKFRDM